MKNIILLFLLLASSIIYTNAQEPVRFGIVGGGNVSTISSEGGKSKLGYHAGLKTEISLTDHFFIDGALLFTSKGFKVDYLNWEGFAEEFEGDLTLKGSLVNNYLELPVHAGAKIKIGDTNSFFISGGPYAAYSLHGKATIKGSKHKISENIYKSGEGFRRFDFGVGLKAGFEFQKHVQLFASYNWGLTNIAKDTKNFKNRNFSISCAYMF